MSHHPGWILAPEHWESLKRAYMNALPDECCGVLLGVLVEGRSEVLRVVGTNNAKSAPGGFAIADYELRRVQRIAQEANLKWLAIYHSHPSGLAVLSDSDRGALRYSPCPWVLITFDSVTQRLCLTGFTAGTGHPFDIHLPDEA